MRTLIILLMLTASAAAATKAPFTTGAPYTCTPSGAGMKAKCYTKAH